MRGRPGFNWALQMPWWIHTGAALLLLLIAAGCYWSWRHREANRRQPRYQFNDRGQLVGRVDAPTAHTLCSPWVCFNTGAGPCTRERHRT